MIRLLAAVLRLTYSLFGWAMAYPEDYSAVPPWRIQRGRANVIDRTKLQSKPFIH